MLSEKDKPRRFAIDRRYLYLLVLSLLLTVIVSVKLPHWLTAYQLNDIAKESVRSPYDFTVPETDISVKKGEIIVREGQKIHQDDLIKLEALRDAEKMKTPVTARLFLLFLVLATVILIIYEYADRNIKKFRLSEKDLIFASALLLLTAFMAKAATTAFDRFVPDYATELFYAIPLFLFGMIMRIVLFSEAVFVFSTIFAAALALMVENGMSVFFYAFLGNLLAAYFSGRCENRSTVLRAGIFTATIISFLVLVHHAFLGYPLTNAPLKIGFIFFGGIASSFIALGVLPVIEHIFAYTTDIKLLELANLERPLLKEMMVNAPGTYHHSIIVGNLSQAAAESIGAHPILTRVAAYYHDIGKLKMPHYFIENRRGTEDAHRNLSPNMSALIILSHVKEGVELAEKYRLGRKIEEIIRQHHGTTLVSYFYSRAKELEDPELYMIEEKDFRYPGPKPQTKETGIIMLADAVEAASRTLEDPTPKRLENLVQKIVENIFVDGQLEECELTLKDLHAIQKDFTTILIGIFHQRIEYPERTEDDGAHKRFPKIVNARQKTAKKNNGKPTNPFRAAG